MYRVKLITTPPAEFCWVAAPFADMDAALRCRAALLDGYQGGADPPLAVSIVDENDKEVAAPYPVSEWPAIRALRGTP